MPNNTGTTMESVRINLVGGKSACEVMVGNL